MSNSIQTLTLECHVGKYGQTRHTDDQRETTIPHHREWKLPITNPKPDLYNMNAHLVKIHWHLVKSSRNVNRNGWTDDIETQTINKKL